MVGTIHLCPDHADNGFPGRNKQEDVVAMLKKYPQYNEYWQDKRAKVENIQVPAYVLASYSTFLHTFGSFRGFEGLQNDNTWFDSHDLMVG